jgi:hypothetical protein
MSFGHKGTGDEHTYSISQSKQEERRSYVKPASTSSSERVAGRIIRSDGRRRHGRRAAALAEVGEDVGAPVDRQLVVGATATAAGGVLDAVPARRVATLVRDVQALALRRVRPVAEAALVAARP